MKSGSKQEGSRMQRDKEKLINRNIKKVFVYEDSDLYHCIKQIFNSPDSKGQRFLIEVACKCMNIVMPHVCTRYQAARYYLFNTYFKKDFIDFFNEEVRDFGIEYMKKGKLAYYIKLHKYGKKINREISSNGKLQNINGVGRIFGRHVMKPCHYLDEFAIINNSYPRDQTEEQEEQIIPDIQEDPLDKIIDSITFDGIPPVPTEPFISRKSKARKSSVTSVSNEIPETHSIIDDVFSEEKFFEALNFSTDYHF